MVASEPVVPEGGVPARLQTERTQKLHSGGCTSGGLLSCGSMASRRAAEAARLPRRIARPRTIRRRAGNGSNPSWK